MTRRETEVDRITRWAIMLMVHDCPPHEALKKAVQSAYDCGRIDGTNKERDAVAEALKRRYAK